MSTQIDKVVSIYKKLSRIPILASAKIFQNDIILSEWTERNLETYKTSKILYSQKIGDDLNVKCDFGFGIDISNELASVISPKELLKAVFREQTDIKDSKKQYLEIWKNKQIIHCIDLNALEIHGDIYTDSEFGSFTWNTKENEIAYIAEKKLPKSEPFYKRKSLKSTNENEEENRGKVFDYKQEWGEQLVGKHLSSIIICHIETESFSVIDWLPDNWSPGQITWSPDGNSIVGVSWDTFPRKLGLMFCTNRPSCIFTTTFDKKYVVISEKGKAVRSPRFSMDGKYLIWFQRDIGGPHHSCHQLVKTAWPLTENPTIEVIIDIIKDEIDIIDGNKFTGIYAQSLPKRPFAIDNKRALFSTPQTTEIQSYVVNMENGEITNISQSMKEFSISILDVYQDLILGYRTSFKQPPQLIIAKLPTLGKESDIKWNILENHTIILPEELNETKFEYLDLKHEGVDDAIKNFTALFFSSNFSVNNRLPLIVWPHGGPHSSFVNNFSLEAALFCILGFAMVQVNFRGSIGAGQNSLMYLSGKVGDADVKDCILAMDSVIEKYSVDQNKCVLFGGSHGGFLVTHLSGQYPDKFKAVFTRNPVIDIASMTNLTDIPDWNYYEAGSEFNEIGPIDDDLLLKMRKLSPLTHAHNVKAATLLCLGSEDIRVPYFQGIEFYHRIKANGCKARMIVYKDNHSLSVRNVEIDHLINGALWFLEHIE